MAGSQGGERLWTWATRVATCHPFGMLTATLGLAVASLVSACSLLEYRSQRNDLLSPDKPCQQRWQRLIERFGAEDDAVVVVAGGTAARQMAAVETVADRLAARPDQFDRIFYKIDLRPLRSRQLQYLSVSELEQVQQLVRRAEPLLGDQGPWGWRMLSLQTLLSRAVAAGKQPAAEWEQELLSHLPVLLRASVAWLEGRPARAWGGTEPRQSGKAELEAAFSEPIYLRTPDGEMTLLLCRPVGADVSAAGARQAADLLRSVLAETAQQYPDVELGLTGLPILESDEMAQADQDAQRATVLALTAVTLLYTWVYRGVRYPLLTLAALLTGTLWALGWATWTVGHLNILSAAFAVMMIGVGDYGVLWVARYDEGRHSGLTAVEAAAYAARLAGPSIVTAAATTAAAFGTLMAVDFRAVAELGWIAGCGVLCCAASCFTVLPALLVLTDRGYVRRCFPLQDRHSRLTAGTLRAATTALGCLLVLMAAAGVWRLRYDHNLLHLQAEGLDSVRWERRLTAQAAGWTWDVVSIAENHAQALALRKRYEALPEVSRVVEVASLLPTDFDKKMPLLREIHQRLLRLPQRIPEPAVAVDVARTTHLLAQLAASAPSGSPLRGAAEDFIGTLQRQPDPEHALRQLDHWLSAELAATLRQLQASSQPEPITVADLPQPLRERYVGRDGAFLVRAWARDDLWDYSALERFLQAVTEVDPEATGKTFRTYEGLRQMHQGFIRASLYALGVVSLVLWIDLRRWRLWLAALLPLALGLLLTCGFMGWCGLAWNPANVVALPLLLGIGVDNGVHVLHDYLQRPSRGGPWRMSRAVAGSILVAGLTTLLGFAALALARHRGLASLGLVMSLGIGACLLSALVLLPACLQLLDQASLRVAGNRRHWWERWRRLPLGDSSLPHR